MDISKMTDEQLLKSIIEDLKDLRETNPLRYDGYMNRLADILLTNNQE